VCENLKEENKSVDNLLDIEKLNHFVKNTNHDYLTTHKKLCFAIIQRIYRRVLLGYRFGAIRVSNDELVVDGNHRYIAYKMAGIDFEIVKANRSFSDEPINFNEIIIDTNEDWDFNNPAYRKFCNDDFLSTYEDSE